MMKSLLNVLTINPFFFLFLVRKVRVVNPKSMLSRLITKREMLKIGKISKHGTAAVYCQGGNFYNCINF